MDIARTPLRFSNVGDRAVPLGAVELVPLRDRSDATDFVITAEYTAGAAQDLVGHRLSEYVDAEAFALLRRRLQRCLDLATPDALRVSSTRRDLHVQLLPQPPNRVVALWADLTEVDLAEGDREDPQHSDAEDLAFVLVVASDGRIEHARWPRLPAAAERLVGSPLEDVLDVDDLQAAFSGGVTTTRLRDRTGSSGEEVSAPRLVTTRLLEDGRRIVFGRDAGTEAPVASSTERAEADRLRTMIGALVDGVGLYESVRDDNGRIVDFRCVEISGKPLLDRETSLARTLREAYPDVVDSLVFDSYVHVVTTGETWTPTPIRYEHEGREHAYQLRAQQCGDGFVLVWRELPADLVVVPPDLRDAPGEPLTDAPLVTPSGAATLPARGGLGHSLTERELEILRLVAIGATTAEIARTLFLSTHTVRNYVRRILARLEARSRSEAVATALTRGLIEVPADRTPGRREPHP